MGASPYTNILSAFGFLKPNLDYKISYNILGTQRIFGIAGRAMPYIGAGILAYDGARIGYCTYSCLNKWDPNVSR